MACGRELRRADEGGGYLPSSAQKEARAQAQKAGGVGARVAVLRGAMMGEGNLGGAADSKVLVGAD